MSVTANPEELQAARAKSGTSKAAAAARRLSFAYAYIANGRNGTQAAISAGYSRHRADSAAVRLLRDVGVQELVRDLTAQAAKISGLETERLLLETARVCFSDVRRLSNPDGSFKKILELDDDTAAAVKNFEVDEIMVEGLVVSRRIKVKFWDKGAALEKAMKHLGLYERDNAQRGESLQISINLVGPP